MTTLTRKFLKFNKIFLLKLSYKNSCVKFDAFQGKNVNFSLKNETLRRESVKIIYIDTKIFDLKLVSINYLIKNLQYNSNFLTE